MVLPAQTHIGAVHLTVSELGRSVRFYESHLGFTLRGTGPQSRAVSPSAPGSCPRDATWAALGVGDADLLVLHASASAPRVRGTTGLYHFAILVPSRAHLARALRRLIATETVLQGAADHFVSEALYLADPDSNGIEIYRDRPREQWPFVNGQLRMGAEPVDFDDLLAEADEEPGALLADGTTIGHVHLHVARLDAAERFYVGVLGFDLMQRYGPSALFVSAGGYHHNIGVNTWAGVGAPPPPGGALGLRHFVVVLPDRASLDATVARVRDAELPVEIADGTALVRDPSSNAILLTTDKR